MYRGPVHKVQNSSHLKGPLDQVTRHRAHRTYLVSPERAYWEARDLGLVTRHSSVHLLMTNWKISTRKSMLERVAAPEVETHEVIKRNVEDVWNGFNADSALEYPIR